MSGALPNCVRTCNNELSCRSFVPYRSRNSFNPNSLSNSTSELVSISSVMEESRSFCTCSSFFAALLQYSANSGFDSFHSPSPINLRRCELVKVATNSSNKPVWRSCDETSSLSKLQSCGERSFAVIAGADAVWGGVKVGNTSICEYSRSRLVVAMVGYVTE